MWPLSKGSSLSRGSTPPVDWFVSNLRAALTFPSNMSFEKERPMLLSGLFLCICIEFFLDVLPSVINLSIFPSAHVLVGVQVGIFYLLPLNLGGISAIIMLA